ncbi:putative RING-H2 finger protein ATL21B isoform X2 [Medicago truncatula]|uniref:putative RING-H2 finger protein ATL21B isoform X2 n=1 Tax=Medicago truncatula TaxID=3880 RepID=UPI000D2F3232|nr:putative RING-H2 finger protein ATL21B isoform X2 [Medicago truncatula]
MSTLPYLISLFILVSLLPHRTTKGEEFFTCERTASCETYGLPIRFPFSLNQSNQTNLCSYPGFDLTCTNTTTTTFSEPLLTLPNSESFVVKRISFVDQVVWVNDPNICFPKRFMFDQNNFMLNLKDSPFRGMILIVEIVKHVEEDVDWLGMMLFVLLVMIFPPKVFQGKSSMV